MKGIIFFLVVVCYLSTTLGKEVILNGTALAGCTSHGECWFFNASLWENNTLPEANDTVIIGTTPSGTSLYIDSGISFGSLAITATHFELMVSESAVVDIENITLSGGVLSLWGQAQVIGRYSSQFLSSAKLHINDWGRFGQLGVNFLLDEKSSIEAYNYGHLELYLSLIN